jgi:hypothetical protein
MVLNDFISCQIEGLKLKYSMYEIIRYSLGLITEFPVLFYEECLGVIEND